MTVFVLRWPCSVDGEALNALWLMTVFVLRRFDLWQYLSWDASLRWPCSVDGEALNALWLMTLFVLRRLDWWQFLSWDVFLRWPCSVDWEALNALWLMTVLVLRRFDWWQYLSRDALTDDSICPETLWLMTVFVLRWVRSVDGTLASDYISTFVCFYSLSSPSLILHIVS